MIIDYVKEIESDGAGPWRSTGAPVRLIQKVVKPNALAPIASQPFDDTQPCPGWHPLADMVTGLMSGAGVDGPDEDTLPG